MEPFQRLNLFSSKFTLGLPLTATRKLSAQTEEKSLFAINQFNMENYVLKEFFLVLIVNISLTIGKKGTIISLTRKYELLISPTTSEKGVWSKSTKTN